MRVARLITAIGLLTAACGSAASSAAPAAAAASATAPAEPTATPIPVAATVNGQPIALADYEAEVARFEAGAASLGRDLSQEGDYRGRVLDALIDKTLMLGAAAAAGLSVSDAEAQAAYDQAMAARGGEAGFQSWLAGNHYTAEQFRAELRQAMLVSAVQSQVAASVPKESEQVHARQILVASEDEANRVLADLAAGADFATLAVERSLDSSRVNGGDLGWFPADGLTAPEVAQAAFALEPDQISGVVRSSFGYHIVQTLERGVRPLSPGALSRAQRQAVEAWRADLRAKAVIEKFVP